MDASGRMVGGLCYGLDGVESDHGKFKMIIRGKKRAQS